VLAAAAGLSGLDVIVMGIAIFAGSAQVIAVERLAAGDSLWLAILPALAINLRYGAILASLRPLLAQTPKPLWPLAVHLTADENWALTLARRTSDARIGHSFLIGSGLCVMAAFTGASALATTFLTQAPDLSAFGISFAFTAAFIALARGLWRGSADFAPWLATAAATLALQYLLDQAALAILLGSATGVAVDMTNRAKRTA
jgi:predicted branched-subunit amino acid permease